MRFHLDQMLRIEVATVLRGAGHDVSRAEDVGHKRANDAEIMAHVIREGRTLVTFDEHFGDWSILPLKEHPGVIRLKIHPTTSTNALALLLPFIYGRKQEDFVNRLVIVSMRGNRWIKTA